MDAETGTVRLTETEELSVVEIVARYGKDGLATLYLAQLRGNDRHIVEFVEAVEPGIPIEQKWVLMISSGFGCPVRCPICDAGHHFHGWLTAEEILSQVDYLVDGRFEDRVVPIQKFKIQFARMGEPSMNPAVLDVLRMLPKRYDAPGIMPCVSTVAPVGREEFFEELIHIKARRYRPSRFRLQFSVHSTDAGERATLMSVKTWGLEQIADYGRRFVWAGDARICLNFAPSTRSSIDPRVLADAFDPRLFVVKLTPINPTDRAAESGVVPLITGEPLSSQAQDLVSALKEEGFEVIVSIGPLEENAIGTNCGQTATRYIEGKPELTASYPKRDYRME